MTGRQTAVLWMGLILIALNFFTGQGWKDLKQALFPSAKKSTTPSKPSTPSNPLLPGLPLIPGIPISTPSTATVSA